MFAQTTPATIINAIPDNPIFANTILRLIEFLPVGRARRLKEVFCHSPERTALPDLRENEKKGGACGQNSHGKRLKN
jgi:hypothetical protein